MKNEQKLAKKPSHHKNHHVRSASYNQFFSTTNRSSEDLPINQSEGYKNLLTIAETEENQPQSHSDNNRIYELQQFSGNPTNSKPLPPKHKRFQSIQIIKSKENFLLPGTPSKQIREKSIEKESNSEKSFVSCLICFSENPDAVFMECGHGGVCYDCSIELWKSTGECYLCREKIIQVLQIDLEYKGEKYIKVVASTQMFEEK